MKKRRLFSLLLICAMLMSMLSAGPTAFADDVSLVPVDDRQEQNQDVAAPEEEPLTDEPPVAEVGQEAEEPPAAEVGQEAEESPAAEVEQATEDLFVEEPFVLPAEQNTATEEDREPAPTLDTQTEFEEEPELQLEADEAEATLLGLTVSCNVFEDDNGARLSVGQPTCIWKNNVEPTSSWYQFYGDDFYTDEKCIIGVNELETRPEPGETYYTDIYLSAPWVSIDCSQLTLANCHITVAGYTVESIILKEYGTKIVLKLTKGPRVLTGFSIPGTGMSLSNNKYRLTYGGCSYTWERDDAPEASAYRATFTDICSNSNCSTPITSVPASGETCYVRCTILNSTAYDHGIDFSQLSSDKCRLTLPDYTAECISVTPGTSSSGQDRVQIVFKLVKNAPYELKGFHDVPAMVRYGSGSSAYYLLASSERIYEWWDDVESGSIRCNDPYLYSDHACSTLLRNEPAQGGSCYTKYTLYNYFANNHDIDFTWLRDFNCSLAVAGYLAECIDVTADTNSSGQDCAYITFKLTRGTYTLTGFALCAEKVRAWETVELEGTTAVCSWRAGETPDASIYGWYADPISTDAACSHWLNTNPAPDTPYYVCAMVYPAKIGDCRFDYSQLTAAACSLSLPGYTTECVSVETKQGFYGSERAYITFKIVQSNPFTDVRPDDYFYKPVLWAVAKGITSGTSATTFSPYNACTRGQVMTFLWKALGSPEPNTMNNPFTDVKSSDYFYKPVLWAVENGITSGTSATTFSPYNACTRGQVMTFLWKALGSPEPNTMNNPFTDVKSNDYFYKPVLWAVENGITAGTSATTFSPYKACTRGQVMTFIYSAMT